MGKLMTIGEVADRLNVSEATLRYLVNEKRAPQSLKVGRRRMFRPEDVEAYIEQQLAKESA